MTKAETIAKCLAIEGWQTEAGLSWLWDRAREVPDSGVWVEVGVYKGRSFLCVLSALCDTALLYGVDDFSGVKGYDSGDVISRDFCRNLDFWRPLMYKMLPLSSLDASRLFLDRSVDVVFIDAAHDFESVKADIKAWLPKIKMGGMICGHDLSDKGVNNAVREMFPDFNKEPGDIWSVRL